jgi:hypothetical protein
MNVREHLRQLLLCRLSPDLRLRKDLRGEWDRNSCRRIGGLIRDCISRLPKSEARMRKARVS